MSNINIKKLFICLSFSFSTFYSENNNQDKIENNSVSNEVQKSVADITSEDDGKQIRLKLKKPNSTHTETNKEGELYIINSQNMNSNDLSNSIINGFNLQATEKVVFHLKDKQLKIYYLEKLYYCDEYGQKIKNAPEFYKTKPLSLNADKMKQLFLEGYISFCDAKAVEQVDFASDPYIPEDQIYYSAILINNSYYTMVNLIKEKNTLESYLLSFVRPMVSLDSLENTENFMLDVFPSLVLKFLINEGQIKSTYNNYIDGKLTTVALSPQETFNQFKPRIDRAVSLIKLALSTFERQAKDELDSAANKILTDLHKHYQDNLILKP